MIKKLWVLFGEDDSVECFCEENRKKCPPEKNPKCEENVVKFVKIERLDVDAKFSKSINDITNVVNKGARDITKASNQLKRSINKFKV